MDIKAKSLNLILKLIRNPQKIFDQQSKYLDQPFERINVGGKEWAVMTLAVLGTHSA